MPLQLVAVNLTQAATSAGMTYSQKSSEKGIQMQYKPSANPPVYYSINRNAYHRFSDFFFCCGENKALDAELWISQPYSRIFWKAGCPIYHMQNSANGVTPTLSRRAFNMCNCWFCTALQAWLHLYLQYDYQMHSDQCPSAYCKLPLEKKKKRSLSQYLHT